MHLAHLGGQVGWVVRVGHGAASWAEQHDKVRFFAAIRQLGQSMARTAHSLAPCARPTADPSCVNTQDGVRLLVGIDTQLYPAPCPSGQTAGTVAHCSSFVYTGIKQTSTCGDGSCMRYGCGRARGHGRA